MTTASERIRINKGGLVCKDPHRTNQSFKNECDLNRILDRAKRGASLSHLENYQGQYGDFSDWTADTYNQMLERKAAADSIFYDLPAEIRAEFNNNPGAFLSFVNDPANEPRLQEIFPELAVPGTSLPDVLGGTAASPDPGPDVSPGEVSPETDPGNTPETA